LIENNTVYLKELLRRRSDVKKAITAPGNKIYGLMIADETYHVNYSSKMWVYKPWMEQLGIAMPETTEDFYQMLKAFKQNDPNGNGAMDEIPLAATNVMSSQGLDEFLMNSFIYTDRKKLALEDGKVVFTADKPEYREGLRYLRKLYEEGLIASDVMVMDRKRLTALGENPGVPILGAAPALWTGMFTVANGESGRDKEYVAISPLTGPAGVRQTPIRVNPMTGNMFNVTKNCKNPELAIRWVDWFYSDEGYFVSQYGQKGAGYREAEAGELNAAGQQAEYTTLFQFGTAQNANWSNTGVCFGGIELQQKVQANELEQRLYKTTKELYEPYGVSNGVPEVYLEENIAAEFTELKTQMEDEITKSFASFVTGGKSLDTDWEEYIQRLKKIGMERYIQLYQQMYDEIFK
jgi:putative aldouronate transport system substrate-binding protein